MWRMMGLVDCFLASTSKKSSMRVLKWTDWMCKSTCERTSSWCHVTLTLEVGRFASIGALSEDLGQLIIHLEHLVVVPHLLI